MELNDREIGQRIRALRKEHRLTQQEFADMLHITKDHYAHIESGGRPAPLYLLADLTDYFDVTLDYLVLGK